MMLSVRTYKVRKANKQPVYKEHHYPCFDQTEKGDTFEEKFNCAFHVLQDEINTDKRNNDLNLYEDIMIASVWLS